jgi:hypothetical protein
MFAGGFAPLEAGGVRLLSTTTVAVNDTVVSLGRGGLLLLRSVRRGRVPIPRVKQRLWGDPQASSARLRQAIVRVNRKLAAVGWRWRIRLDAGYVLVMPEPTAALPVSAA